MTANIGLEGIKNPERRKFLKRLGIGLGVVALELLPPVIDSAEYGIIRVGRDEKDLYAKFENKKFRIIRKQVPVNGSLDGILYELNHSHNPNFPIKGDRLLLLREIFNSVNRQGTIDVKVGQYKFTPTPEVKLKGGDFYNFPYYDLRR